MSGPPEPPPAEARGNRRTHRATSDGDDDSDDSESDDGQAAAGDPTTIPLGQSSSCVGGPARTSRKYHPGLRWTVLPRSWTGS